MKEITSNASLALGEAYGSSNRDRGKYPSIDQRCLSASKQLLRGKDYLKWLPKKEKHTKQNKEDIHAHYDLGNDFYKLWLDPTLTYSCLFQYT